MTRFRMVLFCVGSASKKWYRDVLCPRNRSHVKMEMMVPYHFWRNFSDFLIIFNLIEDDKLQNVEYMVICECEKCFMTARYVAMLPSKAHYSSERAIDWLFHFSLQNMWPKIYNLLPINKPSLNKNWKFMISLRSWLRKTSFYLIQSLNIWIGLVSLIEKNINIAMWKFLFI